MKVKIGIGLMALGVGVWAAWGAWTGTRKVNAVDVPVAISAGQSATRSFLLNYDGLYLIEIASGKTDEAQVGLLGLDAEWSVWSSGKAVKAGGTKEAHSGPRQSDGLARVIGEFNGRAGQTYVLRVKFLNDAQGLNAANPRLKVAVSGLARENLDAASLLVSSTMCICELFGLILLAVGLLAKKPL